MKVCPKLGFVRCDIFHAQLSEIWDARARGPELGLARWWRSSGVRAATLTVASRAEADCLRDCRGTGLGPGGRAYVHLNERAACRVKPSTAGRGEQDVVELEADLRLTLSIISPPLPRRHASALVPAQRKPTPVGPHILCPDATRKSHPSACITACGTDWRASSSSFARRTAADALAGVTQPACSTRVRPRPASSRRSF